MAILVSLFSVGRNHLFYMWVGSIVDWNELLDLDFVLVRYQYCFVFDGLERVHFAFLPCSILKNGSQNELPVDFRFLYWSYNMTQIGDSYSWNRQNRHRRRQRMQLFCSMHFSLAVIPMHLIYHFIYSLVLITCDPWAARRQKKGIKWPIR